MTRTIPPESVVAPTCIYELIHYSTFTPIDGCFVEVGVYKGGTAWHLSNIAEERGVPLFLYDTFEGMPYADASDQHKVGDFSDTSAEAVAAAIPYAKVIKGVFPASITHDTENVAFAHIDCDQYQAIVSSARALISRMAPGGIMLFDDFGVLDQATKAVSDLFGMENIKLTRCHKAWIQF